MKVVVLGGGYCQLNMIKRLKEEGYYIILVDYLERNPGRDFADEHHMISTFDIPAVSDLVLESGAGAIITMGTDQPVLTSAVAAEKAGLPFYVDPETAISVTNKLVMKRKFDDNGIPTARHSFIRRDFKEEDIEGIRFPAVLKPADSQGQRGIFKVENTEQVRLHIDETFSYSDENKVLLEEYYPNDEITVSGIVTGGTAQILSVVDRVTMEKDNRIGICIAHNYPSRHYWKYETEIRKLTQDIVDAFGIMEGPLYFQYLIGENGIMVNEIAMRIGGAYEDIVIPEYSGFDILGYVMDCCFGSERSAKPDPGYDAWENSKTLSAQLFFIRPGTIAYMTSPEELLRMEGVHAAKFLVDLNSRAGDIENATARAGYFVVEGQGFEDTIKKVGEVFDKLKILDENGKNLIIRYDEYKGKYKFI